MIKFLASDFDGTLYRNNTISNSDLSALNKLTSNNNKMIIATGRSKKEILSLLNNYSFNYDYLVLCNGAMILDNKGTEISKNTISNETRKSIIEQFFNVGNALIYYDTGNGIKIIENKAVDTSNMNNNFLNSGAELVSFEQSMAENCDCEIMSIFSTSNSIDDCENIKEAVSKVYGNDVEAFRNSYFVDIVSKGCSKGNALLDILKIEQASPEQLYCIGDSMNDVTMFKVTPNSYTFNYTEDIVKTHANHLVDSVAEVVEQM